ncbi:Transglycosylase SLT domain-containing protein [Humidesulfovibrio mexicanus]|uniref:Transglycosylase SLT domain-containing protein n=1 Tax=Humidesulfovibrio mexicanus TaxID=147047 RepID=A0A239BDD1_9BACT|nr:transglycosylase SLT domain-containing protein [Humidesulfovibrio mexicanus]SNS05876.1 Transglycosylase SLT domain-containing protein [Humidesulfovibrio mexicanus]
MDEYDTDPYLKLLQLVLISLWGGCVVLLVVFSLQARAHAAERIPAAALKYRGQIIRAARAEAGLAAPVAVFAAQIEQESGWNRQAVSPVGARGLGQFMPSTAADMGRNRPDLGPAEPFNPGWAIRALVAYDLAQLKRIRAATPCDAWAMALAAYNGGLGWVQRDQALAKRKGLDSGRWEHVASVNAGRSIAAKRENTDYPRQILLRRQSRYLVWGPGILCEVAQ